jgi:hypothetical protein
MLIYINVGADLEHKGKSHDQRPDTMRVGNSVTRGCRYSSGDQRGRYLGGTPPFGWKVGEAGELVAVPEQQAALRSMRKLKDHGLALRAITGKMNASGVPISHVGVKKALLTRDRPSG